MGKIETDISTPRMFSRLNKIHLSSETASAEFDTHERDARIVDIIIRKDVSLLRKEDLKRQ